MTYMTVCGPGDSMTTIGAKTYCVKKKFRLPSFDWPSAKLTIRELLKRGFTGSNRLSNSVTSSCPMKSRLVSAVPLNELRFENRVQQINRIMPKISLAEFKTFAKFL